MASNRIKNLVIQPDSIYEVIAEAIAETLENMSVDGLGDEGNTNFEIEDVSIIFKDGQFIADIGLQRIEGKFVSNQELEDEILSQIERETISVTVGIIA